MYGAFVDTIDIVLIVDIEACWRHPSAMLHDCSARAWVQFRQRTITTARHSAACHDDKIYIATIPRTHHSPIF